MGLDNQISGATDTNGQQVAMDRVSQRMQAWLLAMESRRDIEHAGSEALRRATIRTARATGFFSIWMTVFAGDADMRELLIEAFPSTRDSGCFDAQTQATVTPAPNPDALPDGGKA